VTVSVMSATMATQIVSSVSTQGTFFLIVDVTLKNVSFDGPIYPAPNFFQIATDDAIALAGSAEQTAHPCDSRIGLLPGGEVTCEVVFVVPIGQVPRSLLYWAPLGIVSAPLPETPVPSATCYAYQSSWWADCAACVRGAMCDSERSAYEQVCQTCANRCAPSAAPVCVCERMCDSSMCQSLFDTYTSCLASACGSRCM